MPPVSLGPFDLIEPVARGGMGEVWSAVHPETQLRAAVKVLMGKSAREERAVQSFRNEMRSLAGLEHPGCVHLFDHGTIDAEASRGTKGKLVEGSPYMVLEWASGGSLSQRKVKYTWPELKNTLLAILDALAHAHSRGVVHRDLKPANLLICGPDDARPGLKLTDFGIAHAVDWHVRSGSFEHVAGTLHYMAPEQITGTWRDYGPWTDLYALGCMAYRLVSGRLPFKGIKGRKLMFAQMREAPPPMAKRLTKVPFGFDDWVLRLMKKSPAERYTRAADAAWALANLGDPDEARREVFVPPTAPDPDDEATDIDLDDEPTVVPGQAPPSDEPAAPVTHATADPWTHMTETTLLGSETTRLHLPVGQVSFGGDVPPLPRTWRRVEDDKPPMTVVGAGLRLFGLRTFPLVGREAERDTLWNALRAVHRTESPRLVYVHGAAGTGKSRLVEWICERAHEVGGAEVLMAVHSFRGAPGAGVRRMVTRFLQTQRMDRGGVERRVREWLEQRGHTDEDDVFALTELLAPIDDADPEDTEPEVLPLHDDETDTSTTTRLVRLLSANERHSVVSTLLEIAADGRPIVVVLEDVQWGPDAVGLAWRLLESKAPILVVATGRDDELAAREQLATNLEAVLSHRRSSEVEVKPLSSDEHHELVEKLLSLESSLAARVAERTGGNPLFAVELVGDWVGRGVLTIGPEGFQLARGAKPVLPQSLHDVWAERIGRAIEGLADQSPEFLELAACLGREVDDEEWQELCDDPQGRYADFGTVQSDRVMFSPQHARVRFALVDRLLGAHLAIETELGWEFTHGMIRESLERRAREHDRWASTNLACANMLGRRQKNGQRGLSERIGLHLLEAGRLQDAIEPLLLGVDESSQAAGYRPALALLGRCTEAMQTLRLPAADVRWARLWLTRARLCWQRADLDEAERYASKALEAARKHDWEHERRAALFQVAQVALRRADLSEAESYFKAMRMGLDRRNEPQLLGMSSFGLAAVKRHKGDFDAAYELYVEGARLFQTAGDDLRAANCYRDLAALEIAFGHVAEARALYRKALNTYELLGRRAEMATCVNGFAECARLDGDDAAAEQGYKRALALYESVEGGQAVVPRLNLGLVLLRREQYAEAAEIIRTAQKTVREQGRRRLLAATHFLLICAAAGLQDWSEWDRHIHAAVEAIEHTGGHDPDNGWAAHKAGDLAYAKERYDRALDAYSLAYVQYQALEDYQTCKVIQNMIASCERELAR